ncbi:MAG: 50S ribosomal protein L23 [Patescibacteria group bacterium]|jgi:large subunit ribosomal protein L23
MSFIKKQSTKPQNIPAQKEIVKTEEIQETEEKHSTPSTSTKAVKLAYRILIKPIITEKITQQEAEGHYAFQVARDANKIEVRKAIKELYHVNPVKVNIMKVSGKAVRYGKSKGRTINWKKALVFLAKGQKIELAKR